MPPERTQRPLKPIFTSNPITRQDPPTISRQKGLCMRKRRASMGQRRKSIEKSQGRAKRREDHPSQEQTNSPPCSIPSGIATKARRATSGPRRHPSPCQKPWKEHRRHQVGLHGSYRSGYLRLRGLTSIGLGSHPHGLGLSPPRTVRGLPAGAVLLYYLLEYPPILSH